MKVTPLSVLLIAPLALTGCPRDKTDDTLTLGEASQAVEESTLGAQGEGLTSQSIEISRSFTLGQAVESAALELSTLLASQRPCALVSLSGSTVAVVYGAHGPCLYNGHALTGTTEVTIIRNDTTDVVVDHRWTALSDGLVQVDGTATVTWNQNSKGRHVVHDIVIERLRDQKTVDCAGDRIQTALDGDLTTGIVVSGTRSWVSTTGVWDLSIEAVQMRWVDPVPQAGSMTLLTPRSRSLSMNFARADADTITITLSGPHRSFSFDVNSVGDSTPR